MSDPNDNGDPNADPQADRAAIITGFLTRMTEVTAQLLEPPVKGEERVVMTFAEWHEQASDALVAWREYLEYQAMEGRDDG